jgi:hypothetical protein
MTASQQQTKEILFCYVESRKKARKEKVEERKEKA